MRPVLHSDEISAPKPPNSVTVDEGNSDVDEVHPDQVGERTAGDPILYKAVHHQNVVSEPKQILKTSFGSLICLKFMLKF
jgi:hypothetical protein